MEPDSERISREKRILSLLAGRNCGDCGCRSCADAARLLALRGFCAVPCAHLTPRDRNAVDDELPLICAFPPSTALGSHTCTALDRVYRRYGRYVKRIAILCGVEKDSLDDAVQEVLLALWLKRSIWPVRNPKGWLADIARKTAHSHCRRERRRRRLTATAARREAPRAVQPSTVMEVAEAWERFERSLLNLPLRMRQAVIGVLVEECSVAETARRMGVREKTVYNMVERGRARLRSLPRD